MVRVPLYRKAETEMLRRIRTGEWEIGQRLGNEFELAAEFGVSQGTMRRALMSLESMGHLARKPGAGTVVATSAKDESTSHVLGFDRLALPDGAPPKLEVFRANAKPFRGEKAEAKDFGSDRLILVERLLRLDRDRIALDEITLPAALLPRVDAEAGTDLPEFLAAHGIAIARIDDRLTAEMSSMGQSVMLAVDRNTALLRLSRTARGKGGEVIARQTLLLAGGGIGYDIGLTGRS